ncbi:uncharacterized protein LOC134261551 [Saccostrea cucullata]|uniref:uncharacterized protein LOC134261551 n=1 Tax=Saccostrea cuccullata TaxID=36930 RepID=UPI002ED14C43
MPLTKVTPRKPGFLCSICLHRLPSHEEWREHLITCASEDMKKRQYECGLCDKAFAKPSLLARHQKRVHTTPPANTSATVTSCVAAVSEETDDDLAWQQDPGELIFDPDLESGRTIRKATTPSLPGMKRKIVEESPVPNTSTESILDKDKSEDSSAASLPFHCPCCKTLSSKSDVGVQTDGGSHKKTVRVIRRYQKDGESIEKFEEEVWNA